jgi:hypothetical protein
MKDGTGGDISYTYYDKGHDKTVGFRELDTGLHYYGKVLERKEPTININVMVCYKHVPVGTINIDKLSKEISRSNASGHPRQY